MAVQNITSSDLIAQRSYLAQKKAEGFKFGLTVADAFVRGIRDIGYRSTATAIDELIDNSIQAEAKSVHVVLDYPEGSDALPNAVAVLDDGHGMDAEMIRMAIIWGGTHREGDRSGFGRYGYGLSSACVSQARRFSVYSRVQGGRWQRVTFDLDDIRDGKYTENGEIIVPRPVAEELPDWLQQYYSLETGRELSQGTAVVLEKLDRLTWDSRDELVTELLNHIGVTYRNFLRQVDIRVDETRVEPVDPLFITPGHRFYDLDEDRAEALEPLEIEVKDRHTGKPLGTVRIRYSYLPPTFARKNKKSDRGPTNKRFAIIKDKVGIIVMRQGRQIDVVRHDCPWTTFNNDDRYWGVEINFPPTLDEEFSITTSKQQVGISDRMWEILREQGVYNAIKHLRKRYDQDKAKHKAERERQEHEKRLSEEIMEEIQKFKTRLPAGERLSESEQRLLQEARRRAEETGLPLDQVERQLRAEVRGRPYKVVAQSNVGAPFFYLEQIGGQKVLYLNTSHRFYTDLYSGPKSTPRLRAGLELLLFVIGECELDATDDRRSFYQTERGVWSNQLNPALDRLDQADSVRDARVREEQDVEDELAEKAGSI